MFVAQLLNDYRPDGAVRWLDLMTHATVGIGRRTNNQLSLSLSLSLYDAFASMQQKKCCCCCRCLLIKNQFLALCEAPLLDFGGGDIALQHQEKVLSKPNSLS